MLETNVHLDKTHKYHQQTSSVSIGQGWTNLFSGRAITTKLKAPASRKISLKYQIQFDKECKFYIKWTTSNRVSPWQLTLRIRVNTLINETNS